MRDALLPRSPEQVGKCITGWSMVWDLAMRSLDVEKDQLGVRSCSTYCSRVVYRKALDSFLEARLLSAASAVRTRFEPISLLARPRRMWICPLFARSILGPQGLRGAGGGDSGRL